MKATKKEVKDACATMVERLIAQGFGGGYAQFCAARTFSEFYNIPYDLVLKIAQSCKQSTRPRTAKTGDDNE